jgi:hypothetical protein
MPATAMRNGVVVDWADALILKIIKSNRQRTRGTTLLNTSFAEYTKVKLLSSAKTGSQIRNTFEISLVYLEEIRE